MRPHIILKATLIACLVLVGVMLAGQPALGQQGPPPGKGGGGGETEAAVNNLSYPAVMIAGTVANPPAIPLEVDPAYNILGTHYSYGCDAPQLVGTTTYNNYSCMDASGGYLTAADCALVDVCVGKTVSRIYWQKKSTSYWKAEETPSGPGVTVQYLDWADNLESKSWTTTSTVRVETTPFHDHTVSLNEGDTPTKRGYQMWHVSGQGTDEVWGVRAAFEGEDGTLPTAVFAYDSRFTIIKTTEARLNISKLVNGSSPCPTAYTPTGSGFAGTWTGSGWVGACTLKDEAYTAELNVGGKYVYGYNWPVRRDALKCDGWVGSSMAGWWRLTFYTPASGQSLPAVVFDTALTDPNLAPPTLPGADPDPLPPPGLVAAEADTGFLYRPVVDKDKNLTYIDICIVAGGGGGGRK